jgi:hypothetical protein
VSDKIPADIDMEDPIMWGLTARQALILATALLLGYGGYFGLAAAVPEVVRISLGALIGAAGIALAFARPDGIHAERFLAYAVRHMTSARRRVLAPEGLPDLPAWARSPGRVDPLRLPAEGIEQDGVIDLGRAGCALVCRARAVNLALRSEAETKTLVAGLARFLNSLDAHASFIVRSDRVDLSERVRALEAGAARLPHPALEAAARAHARYLASLTARGDVMRRDVFVVLRSPGDPDASGPLLRRRSADARALLAGAGISIEPLTAHGAARLLARASQRGARAGALPTEVVRGVD